MTSQLSQSARLRGDDIKRVPEDATVRQAIRMAAERTAAALDRARLLNREDLERLGQDILTELGLSTAFLGFTMVAVNNAFWLPLVAAIPCTRRLFLLPHCLRDQTNCSGDYDAIGLKCAGCGACLIHDLKSTAERLGYKVVVAEGTSSVLLKVLDGEADAILGVACLDSLERSFQRIVELGVPHLAVPLLKDGCVDTKIEEDLIRELLAVENPVPNATAALPRNYVGLLRETGRLFQPPAFAELLSPCLDLEEPAPSGSHATPAESVQEIALQWLREGGKRLRPFITLAAYAVARDGLAVLEPGADLAAHLPLPIRRIALAIEALHKASLVHDDIEDDDDFRYGQPTLHRIHGIAQTINVGDFLIGLGYRLIAGELPRLGADCVSDIVNGLSRAHLELCRGQGDELQFSQRPTTVYQPADVMKVAAQKTAPAFEVALYAGLRAAEAAVDPTLLRRFSTYLGEGFQIRNDLDNWQADPHNKRRRGLDVRAGRPTMLHLFAAQDGHAERLAELTAAIHEAPTDALIDQVYELYCRAGAFAKVEQLYLKLRDRALATAGEFAAPDIQELLRFLVRLVLQEPTEDPAS